MGRLAQPRTLCSPLSAGEQARLAGLEETVERGLASFLEVGRALTAIRDERLYRDRYGRFEDYLRERWRICRGRGYQLIEAARVCGLVSTGGDTPPGNEAQARELSPFVRCDEEEGLALWRELRAEHGDGLTAAAVRRAVRARLGRGASRPSEPSESPLPQPRSRPRSRPGRVYELGRHRLMCGDATDPAQVAVLLDGAEPLLIVTDPPYGVSLDPAWRDRAGYNAARWPAEANADHYLRSQGHRNTRVSNDDRSDWAEAYALAGESVRCLYVWHASRHASEVEAGLERIGFDVSQQIVWDKGLFAISRQHYHWQHEPCWYARRRGARVPFYGEKNQSTVWRAPSPKMIMAAERDAKWDHPTQKPLALFARPIGNHLRPGEVVYDPFAGSGTCLIAAEHHGAVCYAMELEPLFCDLIRARYQQQIAAREEAA